MGSSRLIGIPYGKHVLRVGARPWPRLQALRLRALLGVVGWICSLSIAAALQPPTTVALSGTAAPAGGNYASFNPDYFVLNNAGQVALQANLSGGTAGAGVFFGLPGSLQTVALRGTAAPGGGNYNVFGLGLVLNDAGQLTFNATLTGGTSAEGLFVGTPGSVQAAARLSTAAPGGGNYSALGNPDFNGAGQLAFYASTTGGTSTQSLYFGTAGALQPIARVGFAAPAGGNFSSIDSPVLNDAGQVAFLASLTGGTSLRGIFTGASGALQAAALQGNPAPAGGTYNTFNAPVINAAGQVAFVSGLTGGTSTTGIFVGTPGSIQAAVLQNTAAPGGGTFSSLNNPKLNDAGQVVFLASLTGGTATRGIFVGTPSSILAAAIQGNAAPAGGNYLSFENPSLNAAGQVAFVANLSGSGITTANDTALYAGLPNSLAQVVREGEQVDVDPGIGIDLRTITAGGIEFHDPSGKYGQGISFNDSGMLLYRLTFTDGSSGVFTSVVAVPEPGTLGLLGLSGIVVLWKWCRRRC